MPFPKGWASLGPEDDLVAMERSCTKEFIGPEQLSVLLESWQRTEVPANRAFIEKFAPTVLLEEERAIQSDDDLYEVECPDSGTDMDFPAENSA